MPQSTTKIDRRGSRVFGIAALLLAAYSVAVYLFGLSGLDQRMFMDNAGNGQFETLYNLFVGQIPLLLWVVVVAFLWAFTRKTAGAPWMTAAAVMFIGDQVLENLWPRLAFDSPIATVLMWVASFLATFYPLVLGYAVWKSESFSGLAGKLALAWGGAHAAVSVLRVLGKVSGLTTGIGTAVWTTKALSAIGLVLLPLKIAFLVALGVSLLSAKTAAVAAHPVEEPS
jgi:hypothetical protein